MSSFGFGASQTWVHSAGEAHMNIDLYAKTVLTIIAGCLLWICVTGAIPVASAQAQPPQQPLPPPTRVLLVDQNNVPVSTLQGLHVNVGTQALPVAIVNQSLPVTLTTAPVPVAITAIERQGTWNPLVVDVMKAAPTLQPTP